MNAKKTMLIILSIIMTVLLVQIVSAGITNPLPPELQLKQSESGRFKFQIQNINSPNNLSCVFELKGESPIVVEFDDEAALVESKKIKEFYGTVSVDSKIANGKYTQEFCVLCNPTNSVSGSSIRTEVCGLPVNVNVVDEKTKENMAIPKKPTNWTMVIAIILGVLIALWLIGYLLHQYTSLFRSKSKKGKSKKGSKKSKKGSKKSKKGSKKSKKGSKKSKNAKKKNFLSNLFGSSKSKKKGSKAKKSKKKSKKRKSKKKKTVKTKAKKKKVVKSKKRR